MMEAANPLWNVEFIYKGLKQSGLEEKNGREPWSLVPDS
jgi:hypothetical protein